MEFSEPYKPTSEEIKKAEESMSEKQRADSENREKSYDIQSVILEKEKINSDREKQEEEIRQRDEARIKEIMEKINPTQADTYVKENLKDFENVEVKKMSELPYWDNVSSFLSEKGLDDSEVIVVDDEEKWKSIFGSNDSKSSSKPMAILLKKEIFDRDDISEENMSWLIHEVGHVDFYKSLGGKLDKYMEDYYQKGEYTDSEMEKEAFGLQFEFLKSIGKTKSECVAIIEKYLNESFENNQEKEKKKESEQLMEYINNIF